MAKVNASVYADSNTGAALADLTARLTRARTQFGPLKAPAAT